MVRLVALGAALLVIVSGAGGVVASDALGVSSAGESAGTSQAVTAKQSGPAQVGDANERGNLRFDFQIQKVEKCGVTCRDVTVTATNTRDTTARNVEFVTKMYAGDNVVWTGNETFERVEPGETKTVTKRVNLGLLEAAQVRQNGGYVTAETNVTWDSGNETFTERRKVT